jgi:hypothetical protein
VIVDTEALVSDRVRLNRRRRRVGDAEVELAPVLAVSLPNDESTSRSDPFSTIRMNSVVEALKLPSWD